MADRLLPDQAIEFGHSLESLSGQFRLTMQLDGNLVLYQLDPLPFRALWSSGTGGRGGRAVMQGDGNFVVYSLFGPVWSSRTGVRGSWFIVQNDGNTVIYAPSGAPLWSTKTWRPPKVHLDALVCHQTEDSGDDECSLRISVDGRRQPELRRDMNPNLDKKLWVLGLGLEFRDRVEVNLYDRDFPDPDDHLGKIVIDGNMSGPQLQRFQQDDAWYDLHFRVTRA